MKKISLIIFITIIAFISCEKDDSGVVEQKQVLYSKYQQQNDIGSAIAYLKFIGTNYSKDIATAEEDYNKIKGILKKHNDSEIIGLASAYIAKMGSVYEKDDVIKAVEMVDESLTLMQTELKDKPKDKTLRLYYSITLAHLPSVFKKGEEAHDSLVSLIEGGDLTAREDSLVDNALTLVQK